MGEICIVVESSLLTMGLTLLVFIFNINRVEAHKPYQMLLNITFYHADTIWIVE